MDVSDGIAEWHDIVSPLHNRMNKRKVSGSIVIPKEAKVLKKIVKEVGLIYPFTNKLLSNHASRERAC